MSAASKPFRTWPSRTAFAVEKAAEGWTVEQIARELDAPRSQITSMIASHNVRQRQITRKTPAACFVAVPLDAFIGLDRAAGRRGVTTKNLAAQLLKTIGTDDLIDAVLDDQPEVAA